MWLHRQEKRRVKVGCVEESLLDLLCHAHGLVIGCTRILPKSGHFSPQLGCVH